MKIEKIYYHCFEAGDLCCNQNGQYFVITEVKSNIYTFINLQNDSIKTSSHGVQIIQKGSVSSQPCQIFDKYNYLVNLNKIK